MDKVVERFPALERFRKKPSGEESVAPITEREKAPVIEEKPLVTKKNSSLKRKKNPQGNMRILN